jgi:hypothetical protein
VVLGDRVDERRNLFWVVFEGIGIGIVVRSV